MSGSTLGEAFRVTNWGESHGRAIGAVVDGCPAGIEISEEIIQLDLDRRRPGQSEFTTPRNEADVVQILSGVFRGETIGTPIMLLIENTDYRPEDYEEVKAAYRPSHADLSYDLKFGIRNPFGGGRSSARLTAGTVAAGAIAKQIITGTEIRAYVKTVKDITAVIDGPVSEEQVEASPLRCPDPIASKKMEAAVLQASIEKDSLGGVVECVVSDVPVGLGEPVYHKLEADLGRAMLDIPAAKGFEIGSGFSGTSLKGSEHNDPYIIEDDRIITLTNNSGGIQGGISIGMPIIFRVGFKPTATIGQEQVSLTNMGDEIRIQVSGRHDPCVLPRAVPIVEGFTACVLADHALRNRLSRNQ